MLCFVFNDWLICYHHICNVCLSVLGVNNFFPMLYLQESLYFHHNIMIIRAGWWWWQLRASHVYIICVIIIDRWGWWWLIFILRQNDVLMKKFAVETCDWLIRHHHLLLGLRYGFTHRMALIDWFMNSSLMIWFFPFVCLDDDDDSITDKR